jgi:nucleotide-binding universal stress UspA family protein
MIKILLPLDGSEAALDAVRHALALVQEGLQASFVLANVQPPTYFYEVVLAHDADLLERASREAGAHALAAGQALLDADGLSWEEEVATGDPGHALIDIAERYGCDAVFMGARGVGSVRDALFGSVSQWVLQHSPVPVTIVRRAEPDIEDELETQTQTETEPE